MSAVAESEERPAALRAWQSLGILLVFYVFAFIDRQIISLLVQPIKRDLGLSDIQIGMLQGLAFAIFFSIGGLALGWLVDRASRRWIIFCGMLVWSLSSAGCGLATSFGLLFLARLAVGVGEAALTPSAYSLLHDIFPRERLATAIAIFSSGATVGGGMAYAVGGALIGLLPEQGVAVPGWGDVESWRAAFLITGLPGILLAFLVFAIPEPRRKRPQARAEAGKETLGAFVGRNRRLFVAHFAGFPLHTICTVSLMAWGPAFYLRRFGWETHEVGLTFAAMIGVMGTLGNILGGMAVDFAYRRGMRDAHFRIPLINTVICLPLFCVGLLTSSPWIATIFLMLGFGFLTSYAGPAASALQMISPGHLRGQLSAIYIVLISMVGTGLGPLAVGFVTDVVLGDESQVGVSLAIVIVIACTASVVAMALGLKPLRAALSEIAAVGPQPKVARTAPAEAPAR